MIIISFSYGDCLKKIHTFFFISYFYTKAKINIDNRNFNDENVKHDHFFRQVI